MARRAFVAAGLAVALTAALIAIAGAQAYPRVHVIALSQRADRAAVAPSDIFHVTIHAKIGQQRDRLDELILGTFDNCQIISNETVRTHAADGTDFVERLTVQALRPGEATISPAYLDAIDPTIGRPMRFSSNAIRVHVSGATPLDSGLRTLADDARRLLLAIAIVAGFAAAVFVLGVMFVRGRRRRSTAPVAAAVAAPPPATATVAPAGTARERLRLAADAYRATRASRDLIELRGVLFDLAGTARGATLVDALGALNERDPLLRDALVAAERAVFGPASERNAAGDALLAAASAYDRGAPVGENAWTR